MELSALGYPAASVHGDKDQRQRERALGDFKSGARALALPSVQGLCESVRVYACGSASQAPATASRLRFEVRPQPYLHPLL